MDVAAELGGMVERMIRGAYQDSILPAEERELARMRIAADQRLRRVLGLPCAVGARRGHRARALRERCRVRHLPRLHARGSAWRSSTPSASPTTHASIDDAFFGRLREVFSDEEILDLTLCVAVFLGLGRSLTVLGVDQSCAIDV